MEQNELTIKQAYIATYIFLRQFYLRDNKPDNLRILLSGMQLVEDEHSFDLAMWFDWVRAVEEALKDETLANYHTK